VLKEITKLEQSALEKAESLEQNRWLENAYRISVEFTDKESMAVDTREDLIHIEKYL
jgi:3-deoxy-manno-octulosonate cytidylyltransferase (CMP-KDO synthetase)